MPQQVTSTEQLLCGLGEKVFVTDFDGTMTGVDFYDLVLRHVPADEMPDYWGRCVSGEMTHVEALSQIFQHAPHDESILRSWLPETQLDPHTGAAVDQLQAAGWNLIVVSAGCHWYIEKILAGLSSQVKIVANPGDVDPVRGLWMGWPDEQLPWHSPHFGVDKASLIRLLTQLGKTVAFAGDGRPDLTAAREVADDYRFATAWLAEQLQAQGLAYHSFTRWSEIVSVLTR